MRCGKESKERRNRERLLQGPGSEFSLANPDLDLELDYYDYDVLNAGAAPGSYFGMDSTFLIWIPPMEYDDDPEKSQECNNGQVVLKNIDSGGISLSPTEYRRLRASREGQVPFESSSDEERRSRGEVGRRERNTFDDIILEYKSRLLDGSLPIHKDTEGSRVEASPTLELDRASSLYAASAKSNTADVVDFQGNVSGIYSPKTTRILLLGENKSPEAHGKTRSAESKRRVRRRHQSEVTECTDTLANIDTRLREDIELAPLSCHLTNNLDTPSARKRTLGEPDTYLGDASAILQIAANAVNIPETRHSDSDKPTRKHIERGVNIPLSKFARTRENSPVKVHRVPLKLSSKTDKFKIPEVRDCDNSE